MERKERSTDNSSGRRDRDIFLPQTVRARAIAAQVDAMIKAYLGPRRLTRRSARKILQKREGRR